MNELNDEELMVMYQNGNDIAFRVLYDRHSSKIYGFLKKRIKKVEKVTDIFQEVFIKIHRSKHLYNRSLPALPWLFTVTKSVMVDQLRKEKNFKFVDDFKLDNIPAVALPITDSLFEASGMIQKLPATQKTAIQMRYLDENTFEEIAKSLKTTPTNVRQILSRGVKRLKQLISEGGPS